MKIKLTVICLLLLSYNALFSQKSYGLFVGLNTVNFLANTDEHSEDHFLGQTFGIRYMLGNSKRVKSFDLLLKRRKNEVFTFSGGKGGGVSNTSSFDVTMVHFIGKVSLKEFHKSRFTFYIDGGISLGLIVDHKFENKRTFSDIYAVPQSTSTYSNNLNEFLYKMEYGVVFDCGLIRSITSSTDFFGELQIGASFFTGKEHYMKVLSTTGFRVGLMKLIASD